MSLEVSIRKRLGEFCLNMEYTASDGIHGLLGASGSGKSYALKCIAGIETPDAGRILLNGVTLFDSERHINLPPQKRHVGYLFQNYALFPNMTVRQNVLCGLHYEKNGDRKKERFRRIVEMLKLASILEQKPRELSGGQAQRTALARILVNRPELLMLDEPFSALDSHLRLNLQMEIRDLLEKLQKEVILVTHSRDEAYHMCNDIAVVSRGQIVVHKDTKELFAVPEKIEAAEITGCKNIVAARKAGEHEVLVPEWGNLCFTVKDKVQDSLKAIGIRAHYFNTSTPMNRHGIHIVREMEEPFETILLFRYEGQEETARNVWWRIPKEKRPREFPGEIGIASANILLLY